MASTPRTTSRARTTTRRTVNGTSSCARCRSASPKRGRASGGRAWSSSSTSARSANEQRHRHGCGEGHRSRNRGGVRPRGVVRRGRRSRQGSARADRGADRRDRGHAGRRRRRPRDERRGREARPRSLRRAGRRRGQRRRDAGKAHRRQHAPRVRPALLDQREGAHVSRPGRAQGPGKDQGQPHRDGVEDRARRAARFAAVLRYEGRGDPARPRARARLGARGYPRERGLPGDRRHADAEGILRRDARPGRVPPPERAGATAGTPRDPGRDRVGRPVPGDAGRGIHHRCGAAGRRRVHRRMSRRLEGKVCVIAGAGSAIGRASALVFARERACVVVADVDRAGAEETVKLVHADGGKANAFFADVVEPDDARRLADETARTEGRIDVLFNNAGIAGVGTLHETSTELWDKVMAVNVRGVFLVSKFVVPHMMEKKRGSIINMSSTIAEIGLAQRASYAASKGAILALTRAMQVAYAPFGIRVNALLPGTIHTPFVEKYLRESYPSRGGSLEAIRKRQLTSELGKPEDVASAALFLASDESSFVMGSGLFVDGGVRGGK